MFNWGASRARREQGERYDEGPATAAALHERYLADVYRYVARRVPRPEEAEDITADVFAAAFEALPRFRGDCRPYVWLLGIARRKIADSLRRRAARREMLLSELESESDEGAALDDAWASSAEAPEEALERHERRQAVRRLVAQLDADQREAILLKYVEGLPMSEIAVVMGRSPAAVNSLLQRARATLYRRGQAYFLGNGE